MTPKKIYLSKLVMAGAEILEKPVSDDDVEYIRKDLLLEWAKEQSASCDGAVAMKRAYDKLIGKINAL